MKKMETPVGLTIKSITEGPGGTGGGGWVRFEFTDGSWLLVQCEQHMDSLRATTGFRKE